MTLNVFRQKVVGEVKVPVAVTSMVVLSIGVIVSSN